MINRRSPDTNFIDKDRDQQSREEEAISQTRKNLASFVPNILFSELTYRLRNHGGGGDIDARSALLRPYTYSFRGACLIADISGFTRLSGAFCAKGKDGLDGLQSATSGYMGRLVDVIYRCGGDVIKFAGDALICVFRPKPICNNSEYTNSNNEAARKKFELQKQFIFGDLSTDSLDDDCEPNETSYVGIDKGTKDVLDEAYWVACACAVRCAWELKDICTDTLSLHVAVSCGSLCFGLLGGHENKWEFLVSGDCLMSLSQGLDDAPSKNVALTKECYGNVRKLLQKHDDDDNFIDAKRRGRLPVLTELRGESLESGNVRVKVCRFPLDERSSWEQEEGSISKRRVEDLENRLLHMYTQTFFDDKSPMKVRTAPTPSASASIAQAEPSSNKTSLARRIGASRHGRSLYLQQQQQQQPSGSSDRELNSPPGGSLSLLSPSPIRGGGGGVGDEVLPSIEDKFTLTISTDLVTQASSYVPSPVTQALIAGSFDFIAELREVTTMFMKWDSYDPQKHQDLLSLQEYLYSCQEILAKTGGFLRQFLVDDKGCVLIALWGVPTATYSDNARRALWASVQMSVQLKDMGMSTSIGITTGVVYCGTVGSSLRQEYAAVGDVVNLSARLMCKAKGGILCDQGTISRLPLNLKLKMNRLPPVMVKGKDIPIVPYEYVHNKGNDADDSNSNNRSSGGAGDNSSGGEGYNNSFEHAALDDLEVREVCRAAFTVVLKKLLASPAAGGGNGTSSAAANNHPSSSSHEEHVEFIIVEDQYGAGNEAAAEWLKHQCFADDLRTISIKLGKADATIEYAAMAKLFRCLIREENFDDIKRQTHVVNALLKDTYPSDPDTIRRVAHPSLLFALGVTCPLRSDGVRTRRRSSGASSGFNSPVVSRHLPPGIDDDDDDNTNQVLASGEFSYRHTGHVTNTNSNNNGGHAGGASPSTISKQRIHLPVRILLRCLQDIFTTLLRERPTVIIFEDAHEIDEGSWNILLAMTDISTRALFVLFQRPVESLEANNLTTNSSDNNEIRGGDLNSLEGNAVSYDWIESYILRLSKSGHLQRMDLPDYTFDEAIQYLAKRLKVEVDKLAPGLGPLFYNLTGQGNLFWVREITSFIVAYGVQEFMRNVGQGESRVETPISSIRFGGADKDKDKENSISRRLSRIIGFVPLNRKMSDAASVTRLGGNNSPIGSNGNSIRSSSSLMKRKVSASSMQVAPADSRLEAIVVSQFAKLSIDEQNIARAASIAGMTFTFDILGAIAPERIRPYLNAILKSLVDKHHWLVARSEKRPMGGEGAGSVYLRGTVVVKYSFSHPLLQKTLYDLTPTSVRSTIHASIAKYIEEAYADDNRFFPAMAYHFTNAGAQFSVKAVEYWIKAIRDMLSANYRCSINEVIRLLYTAVDHTTNDEHAVELLDLIKLCEKRAVEVYTKKNQLENLTSDLSSEAAKGTGLSFAVVARHGVSSAFHWSEGAARKSLLLFSPPTKPAGPLGTQHASLQDLSSHPRASLHATPCASPPTPSSSFFLSASHHRSIIPFTVQRVATFVTSMLFTGHSPTARATMTLKVAITEGDSNDITAATAAATASTATATAAEERTAAEGGVSGTTKLAATTRTAAAARTTAALTKVASRRNLMWRSASYANLASGPGIISGNEQREDVAVPTKELARLHRLQKKLINMRETLFFPSEPPTLSKSKKPNDKQQQQQFSSQKQSDETKEKEKEQQNANNTAITVITAESNSNSNSNHSNSNHSRGGGSRGGSGRRAWAADDVNNNTPNAATAAGTGSGASGRGAGAGAAGAAGRSAMTINAAGGGGGGDVDNTVVQFLEQDDDEEEEGDSMMNSVPVGRMTIKPTSY